MPIEIQYEFNILEAVQKTGVNNVHQMRKIESPVGALGPATVAAEELACAAVPQQSFNRILEIHGFNIPEMRENRYGVKDLSFALRYPRTGYGGSPPPDYIQGEQPNHHGANHAFANHAGEHPECRAQPGA